MTLSTVTVDVLDPTPPYEQLRRQLADLIGSGVLGAGDRLPPVRQLAADLGLAPGHRGAHLPRARAGRVRAVAAGRRHAGGPAPPAAVTPERALDEAAAAYLERARVLGLSSEDALAAVRRAAGA